MNYIFDLYGTLVDIKTDEESADVWQTACELLGESPDEWRRVRELYAKLCRSRVTVPEAEFDLCEVFSDMLAKYGKSRGDMGELAWSFREASTRKLRLFPGVIKQLGELRKKGGVYLLSNAQSCFTRRELDMLGLTPLFDGIIISSEVGIKKPSKDVFELALERFKLKKSECIYVGNDMRDDILGASRTGLMTAYVPTEQSGSYPELNIPEPTYSAKDHTELWRILYGLSPNPNS